MNQGTADHVRRHFAYLGMRFAGTVLLLTLQGSAARAGEAEISCGQPVTAALSDAAEVDTYPFSLAGTHDVSFGVSDPDGDIGLLLLSLRHEDGEAVTESCAGFLGARLARGNYQLQVGDCVGSDTGSYVVSYTARPLDYRPFDIEILDEQTAYVTNSVSGTISVVDLEARAVVEELRPPDDRASMRSIAIAPDRQTIYIANHSFEDVLVLDAATRTFSGAISTGILPVDLAITPDGSRAYVAGERENSVAYLDLATAMRIEGISLFEEKQAGIAITRDGKRAYVTNRDSDTVSVLDLEQEGQFAFLGSFAVADEPVGIVVSPDGDTVYVANRGADSVSIIEVETNSVVDSVPVASRPCPGGSYQPTGLALTPDGTTLVVANEGCFSVSLIDTMTLEGSLIRLLSTQGLSMAPRSVAVAADGKAYVANFVSDNIAIVDTTMATLDGFIPLAGAPVACNVPAAPNDDCEDAIVADTASTFTSVVRTSTASIEDSDPFPDCVSQGVERRGRSVWYRFAAPTDGVVSADTFGSSYDTVLLGLSGLCGATQVIPGACDDDNQSNPQSRVAFAVEAGREYRFMASAFEEGNAGTLVFNLTFQGDPTMPTPTPTVRPCAGDCDGSGAVTVDELVIGVQIVLGIQAVEECEVLDTNGDGRVTVDELIAAVNRALSGCGDAV